MYYLFYNQNINNTSTIISVFSIIYFYEQIKLIKYKVGLPPYTQMDSLVGGFQNMLYIVFLIHVLCFFGNKLN